MRSLFTQTFKPGDKVYGLAGNGTGRDRYICTPDFQSIWGNLNFTTDQLNNRFLGTGVVLDGPSIYYSELMYGIEPAEANYNLITLSQADEVDCFRKFLESHPNSKYRPQKFPLKEHRDLRVGRACKAALEFTTTVVNRKIHFVLDDINITDVMEKRKSPYGKKSITGQELRFIYRNGLQVDFNSEYFEKKRETKSRFRARTNKYLERKRDSHDKERRSTSPDGNRYPYSYPKSTLPKPWQFTLGQVVKTKVKVQENIIFWYKGEITSAPWSGMIIKEIWYYPYGSLYEDKIFRTKVELSEADRNESQSLAEMRHRRLEMALKQREISRQKLLDESRIRVTSQENMR
jgi:hypothetical protein